MAHELTYYLPRQAEADAIITGCDGSYRFFANEPNIVYVDNKTVATAIEYVSTHPVKTYLDIGSGPGAVVRAALELGVVNEDTHIIGVEPDPKAIAIARAAFADQPNIAFTQGSSEGLILPDESVDLATFLNGIHLTDPEATLREAARVLRKGGKFIANSAYTKDAFPDGTGMDWMRMHASAKKKLLELEPGYKEILTNPVNLLKHSMGGYKQIAEKYFSQVRVTDLIAEMNLGAVLGIFSYDGFIDGAFPIDRSKTSMPGIDKNFARQALFAAAEEHFYLMQVKTGSEYVIPRQYMVLEAIK